MSNNGIAKKAGIAGGGAAAVALGAIAGSGILSKIHASAEPVELADANILADNEALVLESDENSMRNDNDLPQEKPVEAPKAEEPAQPTEPAEVAEAPKAPEAATEPAEEPIPDPAAPEGGVVHYDVYIDENGNHVEMAVVEDQEGHTVIYSDTDGDGVANFAMYNVGNDGEGASDMVDVSDQNISMTEMKEEYIASTGINPDDYVTDNSASGEDVALVADGEVNAEDVVEVSDNGEVAEITDGGNDSDVIALDDANIDLFSGNDDVEPLAPVTDDAFGDSSVGEGDDLSLGDDLGDGDFDL